MRILFAAALAMLAASAALRARHPRRLRLAVRRRSSAPRRTASRPRRCSGAPAACCTPGSPTPTRGRCCCRTSCRASSADPRRLDLYPPHNSGADNYPYLVATAWFTDRPLFDGRLREMLRNEIRYTNALDGIPADLDLETGKLGPPSLFGAAEYAKDGLLAITELLGRTPWFYRMADMTADLMKHAPVASDFGPLPDAGAELNGDVLQTLVRLATMTGDPPLPRVGAADRRRLRARGAAAEPRPARLHLGLREARGPRPDAAARPRQRDRRGPRAAPRPRERPGRRARRVLSRAARDACSTASWPRPTRTGCSTTRSGPPTSQPLVAAALRQLGLRLRRRLHALHGHRRRALPRGGAARAAERCRATGATTGSTAATTATPTRSRAPSTWWRASRCPRRSTGSRARRSGSSRSSRRTGRSSAGTATATGRARCCSTR